MSEMPVLCCKRKPGMVQFTLMVNIVQDSPFIFTIDTIFSREGNYIILQEVGLHEVRLNLCKVRLKQTPETWEFQFGRGNIW